VAITQYSKRATTPTQSPTSTWTGPGMVGRSICVRAQALCRHTGKPKRELPGLQGLRSRAGNPHRDRHAEWRQSAGPALEPDSRNGPIAVVGCRHDVRR
jgi:hypothetical protein